MARMRLVCQSYEYITLTEETDGSTDGIYTIIPILFTHACIRCGGEENEHVIQLQDFVLTAVFLCPGC